MTLFFTHLSWLLVIKCILFAAAGGLVYGIFGGGSGLILMPGFYYILQHFPFASNYRMQVAIATTAGTSAILGIAAAKVQWQQKNIDFQVIKQIVWALLIGVIIAIALLNVTPSGFLKKLFAVAAIAVALWLSVYQQEKDQKSWSLSSPYCFIMTAIVGILWFLLGIAVFIVPYLHKCRVNMRHAIGSACLVNTIFSALAAVLLMITGSYHLGIRAINIGFVNLPLMLISIIPSYIFAHLGAKIGIRVPQQQLKKIYATLILVVGIIMLV